MSVLRDWLREWQHRALIVLVTGLTFARAVPYALQRSWDDGRFVIDNPDVHRVTFGALSRMFSQVQFEAYHPLHLLSYWLDVPWSGDRAWVIHAVSLVLWIGALLVTYTLMRALQLSPWSAVVGTLACGLHPVQVEAVSWASGRKDVLALLLAAASLRVQLQVQRNHDCTSWMARGLYAAALLAKTTTLPLPVFAYVLDVLVRRVAWRDAARRQLPSALLAAAVAVAVVVVWGQHAMIRETLGSFALAPLRAVQTFGHLLLTAFWPGSTAPMYASSEVVTWRWSRALACLCYALACLQAYRNAWQIVLAGLIGFACMALPVSNLVPMYFPLQDRYLSLPLLPLAIALAGAMEVVYARARRRRVLVAALASCLVAALAARCIQYQGVWRSEPALWGHAVHTHPSAEYAWLKLGEVRRDAGDLEGAICAYRGAVHAAPTRRLAHAALFEAVALRDERYAGRQDSLARALARQYYDKLDHPDQLREFAARLWARGYVRAAELPLQLAIAIDGWPDSMLQRAVSIALQSGRPNLARLYVSAMREPPPAFQALMTADYFPVLP